MTKHNASWLVFLLATSAILFPLRLPHISARFAGNVGTSWVNHTLANPDVIATTDRSIQFEVQVLDWGIMISPDDSHLWRAMGLTQMLNGDEMAAISALRRAKEGGAEFIARGRHAQAASRFEDAQKWYGRAISTQENVRDAWYYLGTVYEETGQLVLSVEAYMTALQAAPTATTSNGDILLRVGQLYAGKQGRADKLEALKWYDQAIMQDAFHDNYTRVLVHYLRADILRELGRRDAALAEYRWVAVQWPDHYWAHIRMGFLTWATNRNASEAEAIFERASTLDPGNKMAYKGLGLIYQATGRTSEAILMFQRVLSIDPGDQQAHAALVELGKKR